MAGPLFHLEERFPPSSGLSRTSMPSIRLWTWTWNQNLPLSPMGFHSLKRNSALLRSPFCGLSSWHLGTILPLKSHIQECQKTFPPCSIILLHHSSTILLSTSPLSPFPSKNAGSKSSFGTILLILSFLSTSPPSRTAPPSIWKLQILSNRSRLISHWVSCSVFIALMMSTPGTHLTVLAIFGFSPSISISPVWRSLLSTSNIS